MNCPDLDGAAKNRPMGAPEVRTVPPEFTIVPSGMSLAQSVLVAVLVFMPAPRARTRA